MITLLLQILVFSLFVVYVAHVFKMALQPVFLRQDFRISFFELLAKPLLSFVHNFRSALLDPGRDIMSVFFIGCYSFVLYTIASLERKFVVDMAFFIFLTYVMMAFVLAMRKFFGGKVQGSSLNSLLIAIVQLSVIICVIGILQKFYFPQNESVWATALIQIYSFLLLLVSLSLTAIVSSSSGRKEGFYQGLEVEMSRLTWVCVLVAMLNPDELHRYSLASPFMAKVIFVYMMFQLIDYIAAAKSIRLKEEWTFKFAIPIGFACIFAVWLGASYV